MWKEVLKLTPEGVSLRTSRLACKFFPTDGLCRCEAAAWGLAEKEKLCAGSSAEMRSAMADFKKSVVYQIYPKSFYDSNHDGLGDLRGVIEKLDYVRELGVDYIWLTPFFVSPQNDNGYDVEDYYRIDPRYGTMGDFEELVREADRRGIRLMLDICFFLSGCT